MFIGYLSSFFIALLLSFFYLGYAASGIFEQIGREIKKEITNKSEEQSGIVSTQSSKDISTLVFNYSIDLSESKRQVNLSEIVVDIVIDIVDISTVKICLSEYFLRPPPAVVI